MCFHFAFHMQGYGIICSEFPTGYSLTGEASVICVSRWVSSSTHFSVWTRRVSKLLMPKHLFSTPASWSEISLLMCFPGTNLLLCFIHYLTYMIIWSPSSPFQPNVCFQTDLFTISYWHFILAIIFLHCWGDFLLVKCREDTG